MLVVTLDANIPVLGDADFVIKMENRPFENNRQCVAAQAGCFELRPITEALLELEGGEKAFHFRQHRYKLGRPGVFQDESRNEGTGGETPVPELARIRS